MPTEGEMSVSERRTYLKRMKVRYVAATRGERSGLLSEMEQVTGLHRKSVTRLMHAASLERKKRTTPRAHAYGLEVERIIVRVWESRDYICAERLTPSPLTMAQHLARFEPHGLTAQAEAQLATISRATVGRISRKYRARRVRLPQKGAERANQVTKGVPMGRIPWDIGEPGHFEVDLVHHSGESTAGLYGHTIQLVDVHCLTKNLPRRFLDPFSISFPPLFHISRNTSWYQKRKVSCSYSGKAKNGASW
jgi:hypothetical protein